METKRPAKGIATTPTLVFMNKNISWKPKDPPRGLRLCFICSPLIIFIRGNQKTRQGDCDKSLIFSKILVILKWKPKDPPRGLRLFMSFIIYKEFSFCGNQKTRQGDCDQVLSDCFQVKIQSWKPKDPPRGLRLFHYLFNFSFDFFCGNQKTRQGDCD